MQNGKSGNQQDKGLSAIQPSSTIIPHRADGVSVKKTASPVSKQGSAPCDLPGCPRVPVHGASHHKHSSQSLVAFHSSIAKERAMPVPSVSTNQGILIDRSLPIAPVTASSKLAVKIKLQQIRTPLTDPDGLSSNAKASSDNSASSSAPSSSDASSYQPSSVYSQDGTDAGKNQACMLAAKPPLPPKKAFAKSLSAANSRGRVLKPMDFASTYAEPASPSPAFNGALGSQAAGVMKVSQEVASSM